jgi:TrmH family RNA methyltransferase
MLEISHLVSAGLHSPQVKQYLALKNSAKANTENLVCLEGLRALSLAVKANLEIQSFFVCPERLRGEAGRQMATNIIAAGVPSYNISERVLNAIVEWEGPDGLAAIVKLRHYRWQDIQLGAENVLLVLDGLQIPGNIGTIIRCADGAGADGIIITNRRQRLSHPKLVRASMGSIFGYPVIETEADEAIRWLHNHGFSIVTTNPSVALSYRQTSYLGRIAIVLGNEHHGISSTWFEAQDVSVSIPMYGQADSLNVGNAAVLMLYEVLHQQAQARSRSP